MLRFNSLASALRNPSCSHGWLRFVVQCVFFALTVTSFILILLVSLRPYSIYNFNRCQIHGCRVICSEALFDIEYENDIIFAVTEAETRCQWVLLTLNGPTFRNSTLPPHWLSRMRTNIHELAIAGGNLQYISLEAFMTHFAGSIRCLILEKIVIKAWNPHTLVGLSNLQQLIVKYAYIRDIRRNSLEAVDNTLEKLIVTASGSWDPKNLTGSTNFVRLRTVDFSSNLFSHVINRESFTKLKLCEVLFLNSCGIETIGAGAFDYLTNIKVLHLNNNFLVTVPIGLFKSIASNVDLRVNLHDNMWLCDCGLPDLRLLSDNDMILVDPTCHFPEHVLREIYNSCAEYSVANNDEKDLSNYKYIHVNGSCDTDQNTLFPIRVISPIDDFSCPNPRFRLVDLENFKYSMENSKFKIYSNMSKPTFTVTTEGFFTIDISSTQLKPRYDFGFVWYHAKCPHEIYCLNILPNFLRILNFDVNSLYIFCPLRLSTGLIQVDECFFYDSRHKKQEVASWTTFYILTAIAFLVIGCLCVCLIFRLLPYLLKGSNRILFLRYKNVKASVLPTKTPLKTKLVEQTISEFNNTNIFVVPGEDKHSFESNLKRTELITSTTSNAPSYISALQPTEDSLAHWRLRHHFNNNTVTSTPSYNTDENSLYCSLDQFSTK